MIVSEKTNVVNQHSSIPEMIRVALNKIGELYWCYGKSD